ncbi:MAG: site-2 protease family protein [Oscillospiraceae bacterium]|nr:site-2 protease family protein [Oscillospiraceae bacterium]
MQDFFKQLDYSYLLYLLMSAVPALLCITIHESAHGLAAWLLGDDTARAQGRISLNPLRHIDPVGLLMLAVAHFGWAKPVSINPANFKNPKLGMAVTALAGPVSNFILWGILTAITPLLTNQLAYTLVYLTAQLSWGLGVFNLIPIPPLDGSKVLFSFLPNKAYFTLMRYEKYGMPVILLGILALRYFGGS